MVSVLFTIAFVGVVTGLGWSLVGGLDRHGRLMGGERLATSFMLGCGVVYFSVFFIGPWRLDAVSMGSVAGVLALLSVPGLRAMPWPAFARTMRAELNVFRDEPWTAMLWLAAGLIGLSSVIQGLAPINDYDSLLYHLALPRFDVETGFMTIPWDRHILQVLTPAFGGNLSRLILTLSDEGAAQMVHGVFGLVTALGTAMLARRLGFGKTTALLSAVLFLAVRAVIWEMATVETDVLLAAAGVLFLVVYLAWRENPEPGLGALFGILVAVGILIKQNGYPLALSIGPLIVYDMVRNRHIRWQAAVGPMVALAVIMPHMIRLYLLSGNPVFPLFNSVFNAGARSFLPGWGDKFGVGRDAVDLIAGPWNLSILPLHYFDGMILGAPYLLALCPLALLIPGKKRWLPPLSFAIIYYVIWFYLLSQQVRFLIHVIPVLAVLAAAGAGVMWERTRSSRSLQWTFSAVMLVLAVNQFMFIGVYSAIRLPPAFGLIDAAAYHERTPTLTGAHYKTCTYIADNLKAGERYYSDTAGYVSYYCPQAAVIRIYFPDEAKWWLLSKTPPTMPLTDFIRRAEQANIRFFIMSKKFPNRRNVTAKEVSIKVDAKTRRFGVQLVASFEKLKPLIEGPFTAVYDGKAVIELLRQQVGAESVR